MKITLIYFVLLFSFDSYALCETPDSPLQKITSDDLKILTGDWTGTITYLDYQTNKPFTMPANLTVKQSKNKNRFLLYNIYPNESKANSKDKIKITKKGTLLNKRSVTSRQELPGGQIQIKTEFTGKDDNRKAIIQHTYLLGKDQFSIVKEVKFENSADWIKRSEFNYTR